MSCYVCGKKPEARAAILELLSARTPDKRSAKGQAIWKAAHLSSLCDDHVVEISAAIVKES